MSDWLIVLLFFILNYGMSNIVVFSNGPFHIFYKFRNLMSGLSDQLGELFSCMICYPTWNGMILSVVSLVLGVYFTPFTMLLGNSHPVISVILDGAIGSGSSWLIHNVEEYFERSGITYTDEDDKINLNG